MEILRPTPVDVLVLDIGLPGMSGTDVVRALRQRSDTATLPILLMTGSGTDRSVIEGLEAGADDFLAKPVRLDELVARVRAHLRSRAAWSGIVEDELRVRANVVGALSRMALSSDPESAAEAVVGRARPPHGERVHRGAAADVGRSPPAARDLQRCLGCRTRWPGGGAATSPVPSREGTRRGPGSTGRIAPGPTMTARSGASAWRLISGAPIYFDETLVGVAADRRSRVGGGEHLPRPPREVDGGGDRLREHPDGRGRLGAGRSPRDRGRGSAAPARCSQADEFHVVFQPIVDLETRAIVGYEALTRFSDGTPPDIRFADADETGTRRRFRDRGDPARRSRRR